MMKTSLIGFLLRYLKLVWIFPTSIYICFVFQLSSKSSLSESASLMAEMQNSAAMATGNMMASGSGTGSQAMSEQLMNKDSLLIHKLELENQRLRSELDDVKLNGLREQSEKLLELEQEVKRKDLTLKQVEAERSKDSSQFVTLEKELHQSTNKVQQLEQVKSTVFHPLSIEIIYKCYLCVLRW